MSSKSRRLNFNQTNDCWYCREDRHGACTIRYPKYVDGVKARLVDRPYECQCWVYHGRKPHRTPKPSVDDAVLNILGAMNERFGE